MTFAILKVGGSCLAKDSGAVARNLAALPGKCVLVHGYSVLAREILAERGIERRKFVSASGVASHFTGEAELAASLLAATLEGARLAQALTSLGLRPRAMLGHRGLFFGERKRAIRYRDGGALRVVRDDLSGKVSRAEIAAFERELETTDLLIVGSTIWDAESGPLVADADSVASLLARSMSAKRYDILSDVDGFAVDGRVLERVHVSEMETLFPHALGGMSKKLRYILEALEGGVTSVILRNGLKEGGEGTCFHANDSSAGQQ